MVSIFVPIISILLVAVPAVLAAVPIALASDGLVRFGAIGLAPLVFGVSYVVFAGVLSIPFRRKIVAGKFPRDLKHAVYGPRRLYGLCWTAVYYSGPIYQLALTIKTLRTLMLRLFGYRGSCDLTLYSDTWIRDLPLLEIARGAYLSNKATIGTNICLQNGDILVDAIVVGANAMIGHLAMLAPGAVIGANAEIGVGVAFGIKAKLGERGRIGPGCVINHGASIGPDAEIGTMSYIGTRAKIGAGIRVPPGSRIPDRAVIETAADLERYVGQPRSPSLAA
jgi:acetyltransferase-like isoleucine patch superfamily enzyme